MQDLLYLSEWENLGIVNNIALGYVQVCVTLSWWVDLDNISCLMTLNSFEFDM